MTNLLRRPVGSTGHVHAITPENAGWGHVGFDLYRLKPGAVAEGLLEGREAILVVVEGKVSVTADGTNLGVLGTRMDVFERVPPACVYAPPGASWRAVAETDCTLAVCTAPGKGGYSATLLGPVGIGTETRGEGTNTRYIHPIAMEERDVAESLLVTEVYTPAGHWSSYPPHRHDEDRFPDVTYLEETYYHRLKPSAGFGIQRVYTEDGELNETMAVADHDVVLVPKGHHPCAAPYGYDMYYLNVMAGPLRKWRFKVDPDFEWLMPAKS